MGETKAKKAIQKRKKALLFDLKERIFHAESKNFTKKLLTTKLPKKHRNSTSNLLLKVFEIEQ